MSSWRVEVLSGLPVIPEAGIPVEFGTPTTTVDDSGDMSEPTVGLVYDPVGLRIDGGSAWLYVRESDGSNRNFRFMDHVTDVEVDWWGSLRLRGMEAREDGTLVTAIWECNQHIPTAEERAEGERILREAGFYNDENAPPAEADGA